MVRGLKIGLIGIGVILLLAAGVLTWFLSNALPVGAGFVAKYLCSSSTFISQREPNIVFQEDIAPINPIAKAIDWQVNRESKSVRAKS